MPETENEGATLYYVEAIDAGNPENKVDFRDSMAIKRLSQNASLLLKPNNAFLWLFGKCNYRNCF
jgi:hypothetical protein